MEFEAVSRSPHEVFLDVLEQTAEGLQRSSFVTEWMGPKQRLPVFDVAPLRAFAADASNRDRLATLLASYVRVRSGSLWERSGGRWRRRRYSELNPVDLAELGAFGRLGDLSLFLSGVFPEHVAANPLEARGLSRIAGLLGEEPGEIARSREPFWLMEWIGRAAYRRAGAARLASDFRLARRLLNLLTDEHLFPMRERWFGAPGRS